MYSDNEGGGGVGQGPCAHGKINISVHSNMQKVCGSCRIVTALVLKFAGACWGITALLTSYLMLST